MERKIGGDGHCPLENGQTLTLRSDGKERRKFGGKKSGRQKGRWRREGALATVMSGASCALILHKNIANTCIYVFK